MNGRAWIRVAAFGCAAVLLLALGAALRPLFTDDPGASREVLSDTEIGFVQDMLAHHNQALLIVARLEPGADPTVRALAQQIADTQRTEIGMLLGWLRLARAGTTNPRPMAWMHNIAPDASGHHHSSSTEDAASGRMPGMASRDELDALADARGTQAETQFLRLMQRHHYGGIQMAHAADGLLTSGVVKQTARDMVTGQGREAGLMGLLLAQRAV
ncbi:DUF305 domain-containing protein [Nocardia nepalensis]|uniref:DUF305 domain-containing protein n=1 Tax=Nocardia nepalensis TaxID=3375448 RepID=UPI003B66FCCB